MIDGHDERPSNGTDPNDGPREFDPTALALPRKINEPTC